MRIKNQRGFSAVEALLILVIVGIVGGVGWYVWSTNKKTDDSLKNADASSSITTNVPKKKEAKKTDSSTAAKEGSIKGKTSYPSERLPDDLKVCAEDTKDKAKTYCVDVGEKQLQVFELKVLAGTYYVYQQKESDPNHKAYWNEFAKCGLDVSCPESGHKQLIPVTVESGKTVEGVDPGDWYAT